MASSSEWAARMEQLQYTVGEGPGMEAFTSGGPVLVADTAGEDGRWPGFTSAATEAGVAAVFAFPLQAGAVRLGTLDLYRHQPGGLDAEQLADATVLADLATVAVLDNLDRTSQPGGWASTLPLDLRSGGAGFGGRGGVGHYDEINLAIGMLAAQLHLSVPDASARLRAHAFSRRQPLDQVARDLIASRLRLDDHQEPHD